MTSGPRMPAALRRLWRLPDEPARVGRPAVLDVERVVAAAIALADADGLSGVTLPKVATALGVTSMSLYRHVGSKDELLTLMSDAALGEPPRVGTDARRWKDNLRAMSEAQREVLSRHPWQAWIPVTGPPSGPHHIAWMDAILATLSGTRLSWGDKVEVMQVIGGYVQQSLRMSQEMDAARGEDVDEEAVLREYGMALFTLVDPQRFPEAAKLFRSDAFAGDPKGPDEPDAFHFGLEVILDGVEAVVHRAARRHSPD
ncbi:MAG TPA: TetR/AcrR family transcriptional regulator [Stackebrandtia sp.]|uniref:TetR/AcrR family transcriptional regulator n=1 Tax=Stackebrandtia sp. TaxID=2023065 RepID=UPI002D3B893B|nr:TetR/AcrR family transcriptional regulator [Stackebrandtia sp.]HZE38468.1 TetR/AcrR family transcriptional regulator [Stackebrandtia sp.]